MDSYDYENTLELPPTHSNSHHQDYYICFRESLAYKPLFVTISGRGVDRKYTF